MELGLDNIIVEGDLQQLVRMIQMRMADRASKCGDIAADISSLARQVYKSWDMFCEAEQQWVAHKVAQRALRSWITPNFVQKT